MGWDKELQVAKEIAKRAGEIILRYFDGGQQAKRKEDGSPVTIADLAVNRMVIEELAKHFKDGVVGEEESTADYGLGRRWFCDPIDGTKAYTWHVPTAMFSLGLVVDGVPVLGVAYDPFLARLYEAVKGQGSFCNSKPLHVSECKQLKDGIMAVTSNIRQTLQSAEIMQKFIQNGVSLASYSGAVHKSVGVAAGYLTGYFEVLVNGHDMAAVQVIVEEAGGRVTGLQGEKLDYAKPFNGAIVSNSLVHEEIVNALR